VNDPDELWITDWNELAPLVTVRNGKATWADGADVRPLPRLTGVLFKLSDVACQVTDLAEAT
jgi:hypothetical protein